MIKSIFKVFSFIKSNRNFLIREYISDEKLSVQSWTITHTHNCDSIAQNIFLSQSLCTSFSNVNFPFRHFPPPPFLPPQLSNSSGKTPHLLRFKSKLLINSWLSLLFFLPSSDSFPDFFHSQSLTSNSSVKCLRGASDLKEKGGLLLFLMTLLTPFASLPHPLSLKSVL